MQYNATVKWQDFTFNAVLDAQNKQIAEQRITEMYSESLGLIDDSELEITIKQTKTEIPLF